MATVSVTSKGQVTIPKQVRRALGITPGSKVEFDVEGGGARLKLVKKQVPSRIADGSAILNYTGPRIPSRHALPKRSSPPGTCSFPRPSCSSSNGYCVR